ncbi:MAG TPA: competence/damage-inducible protein A [Bacteroidales bacterium]|nr:competence/damage-inducible protein A [Bacteroidales bacterium]
MVAEIITIGNELLCGKTMNTNASWISERLYEEGFEVRQVTVVSDQQGEITRSLNDALGRSELVIITGGLGPTSDDITKVALSAFFGSKLVHSKEVLEDIADFFRKRNLELTDRNRQQALVPEKARILRNNMGTAPGLWFEKDNKICIALPGVPPEMKNLIMTQVIPLLKGFRSGIRIIHRTILTHGIGESFLSDKIAGWEKSLPDNLKLAYLPSAGIVKLRLTATGKNENLLKETIADAERNLVKLIPKYIWGFDQDTFEQVVGNLLATHGYTLSTAESCTGGQIAGRIVGVPGSSRYFRGSIVAYSNELKTGLLGVEPNLISSFGTVSKQVVESMARNGCRVLGSNFCVATSGIAGPDGGSEAKPVGTVWIAVAFREQVQSKVFRFGDQRLNNIARSSVAALAMLREVILQSLTK